MNEVLISGSAGFVGRNFQKWFANNSPETNLTLIDIKEGNDCRAFFKMVDKQFDLCIHLAATVEGRMAIEGEPLRVASNLELDSCFFNWAVQTNQERLVYYSSSAAYPVDIQRSEGHQLKESYINLNHIRTPDLSYGWAKLTGEMLASYAQAEGLNVHVFRPFSGYGTDQDLHYPFPSFIQRVKDRCDPFEIWGSGNQVRDFIHIDDVIEATMVAVEQDVQEPVNLGTGVPTSFKDLADLMFTIAKWSPKVIMPLIDKPVGVHYRCADPSKMLEFYAPQISLEEGIRRALTD
jgi:nucleoside-diphosphate-sugar epimerase